MFWGLECVGCPLALVRFFAVGGVRRTSQQGGNMYGGRSGDWRGCCDFGVERLEFASSGIWSGQMAMYFFLSNPSVKGCMCWHESVKLIFSVVK